MGPSRGLSGVVVALVLVGLCLPDEARAQVLGEEGESCRARSDCIEGLRCIENTCVASNEDDSDAVDVSEEGEGEAEQPGGEGSETSGSESGEIEAEGESDEEVEEEGSQRWADFELGGVHFFAGLTFAPGMTGYWPYGGDLPIWASFFFAFRLGALFNRTELSIELAPATWVWDFDPSSHISGLDYEGNLNSLSFLVNIGGLVEITDNVYWPFRFGLGLSAHELPLASVYMQGRLDVIGLVYQHGHLLFELNLPSIRFHSDLHNIGIWGWLFTFSVSYVV